MSGAPYASYDGKEFYRSRNWLIGDGEVGGKAKGVAFAVETLQSSPLKDQVRFPEITYVLTTEAFNDFMVRNNLEPIVRGAQTFDEIERAFEAASFPNSLRDTLTSILSDIRTPIAVRSSSVLEDDLAYSFAGKYSTRFFGNSGDKEYGLHRFERAIKLVYASTFNPSAKEYRRKHGIKLAQERMAVIIQPIVGKVREELYYPELAGVAFSKVYRRPSPRVKKDDGLLRLCFGLGTKAVARANAKVFYLSFLGLKVEGSKTSDVIAHAQDEFDYIDMKKGFFSTRKIDLALDHIKSHHKNASAFLELSDGEMFYWLHGATDVNGLRPVMTFSGFPRRFSRFFVRIRSLLKVMEERAGLPVDLEFTYDTEDDHLALVQMRPLATFEEWENVEIPKVSQERIVLRGNRMISNGKLTDIRHLVLVAPELYMSSGDYFQVARAIGEINAKLSGERYILVGPGRWGSTNPLLGVPVTYGEISGCGCIVELSVPSAGIMPELSYGSHFFLDLDTDKILYLPIFCGEEGNIYNVEWLNSHPFISERHGAVRIYEGSFGVYLNGEQEVGIVVDET